MQNLTDLGPSLLSRKIGHVVVSKVMQKLNISHLNMCLLDALLTL